MTTRRGAILLATAVSISLVAIFVFMAAFTRRYSYDDEGYMLVMLRGWMSGHALYNTVYSQYGPGFFAVIGGVPRLFGMSTLSIEQGRAIAGALGCGTAAVMGYVGMRLTKSVPAGLLTMTLTAVTIPVGLEASLHPTQFVDALVALVVLGVVLLDQRHAPRLGAIILGTSAALLVLTKINAGGLVVVAIATGLRLPIVGDRVWKRLAGGALVAGGLAAVAAANNYPTLFVTLLFVAAVVTVAGSWRARFREPLPMGVAAIAAAVTGIAVTVLVLTTGTSVSALVRGVLLDPLRQPKVITIAVAGGSWTPLVIIAVVVVITLLPRLSGIVRGAVLVLAGGFVASIGVQLRYLATPQLNLVVLGVALSWLVLAIDDSAVPAHRVVIAALGVLLPLEAYPVAGGQRLAGSMVLPLIGVLVAWEGCRLCAGRIRLDRLAPAAFATAAVLVALVGIREERDIRRTTVPSALMGPHIGIDGTDARNIAATTAVLRHCPAFYGLPGLDSFYLFTGQQPPTWLNAGTWMTLFDTTRQEQVVATLRRINGLCVLRDRSVEKFWTSRGTQIHGPLRDFLESKKERIGGAGEYAVYR